MADIEMNGLQTDVQKQLFDIVIAKSWKSLVGFIQANPATFLDISQPNKSSENRTILHYACNEADSITAKEAVDTIFQIITLCTVAPTDEELKDFLNATESNKRTALQYAIEKGHDNVIKFLLGKNVDTSIEVCKLLVLVNSRYRKLLLEGFDQGIYIRKDQLDPENQDLWSIYCNFKLITGDTQNKLETRGLSKILSLERSKRSLIVMHGLVQIFIDAKCKKYQWWNRFSMTYHILWYLLTAFFLTGTTTHDSSYVKNNSTANSTDCNLRSTNSTQTNSNVLSKQNPSISGSIVASMCPNWKFYFRQLENWGQIVIFIVAVVAAVVSRLGQIPCWAEVVVSIVYATGLVTSLLLVQGQFTKSQWLGKNNQMMMKTFKKLIPFFCTFLLLFIAFTVILHLIVPDKLPTGINTVFVKSTKMFGALTGELNLNDVFSEENVKDISFVIKSFFVYTLLILVLLIIFLNLLIANTVNDIEKLKTLAIAAHYSSRLEVVNILEACLVRMSSFLGKRYSVLKVHKIKGEENPEGFEYGIKYKKLLSHTRKFIYENQSKFYEPEDQNQ